MKPTIKEEALDKPMAKRLRTAPSSLILLLATSHLRRTTTPRIRKAATRREAAWHPTSFEHASAMKFLNPIWRKNSKEDAIATCAVCWTSLTSETTFIQDADS